MAPVFHDSGSSLTSIGAALLSRMLSSFGGPGLPIPLENWPRTARTATGANVTVTHKTVPIEVSVRTPWGAVKVPPITFAVMPGSDDVVLFGMATMKELGLDLYPWALEKLRPRAVPVQTGVESPSFLAARRVTLSVQSFSSGRGYNTYLEHNVRTYRFLPADARYTRTWNITYVRLDFCRLIPGTYVSGTEYVPHTKTNISRTQRFFFWM